MPQLAYIAALGCAVWFVQAGMVLFHISRLNTPSTLDSADPEDWPSVTALVPAKDEECSIAAALTARLADGYPALQVIAIDDRSTDATGRIIDKMAQQDTRVVPLHIDSLPQGWLGKVHALARGVAHAQGEWLLLSDADAHIAPGGLKRAVAYCMERDLDFLALVPEFRSRSFIVNVLWSVFMRVLAMFVDPAAVRDPASSTGMGSGAFMLARTAVFDRTEGFEHLRMETTDDIAFGLMMKRAGARCDFANGRGVVSISIYDSLGEFFRGVEKNAGSLARAPFAAVALTLAVAAYFEYAPFLALASGVVWAQWLGAAAALAATVAALAALRVNTGMVLPALLWPVGWLLVAAGILRSAWLFARQGGIVWRDTFHSREELVEGQRFRMM